MALTIIPLFVCLFVCLFVEDYDSPWKLILSFFLKGCGGKFFLHCNFSPLIYQTVFPVFRENALQSGSN